MISPPKSIRWLFCLVLGLVGVFPAPASSAAATEPLVLGSGNSYYIAGHMEVLKDPSENLEFRDALAAFERGDFQPMDGNLNAGYGRAAYWIHFSMIRQKGFPEKAMLSLSPSYTNSVKVYVQRQGRSPLLPSSFRPVLLGSDVPVAERPVLNPNFIVPLELPADEPVDVFVRVYSKGSISLTGVLATPESIRNSTYNSIMLQFGYLGIAAVLCVMNLIFFISIRDRLFLYFALYVLTVLINNFGVAGMQTLILPAYAHVLSDYMVYMGIGAQLLVFSEFCHNLFRDFAGSWTLRYMRLMSATGVLTIVSVPFGLYASVVPFALVGTVILIALLLLTSKKLLVSMPQSGIFITIAFGISTLGYFYQIFRLIGVFPLEPGWDINMIEPATLVHMVLISIALSERFRITERQLGEASREAEKRAKEIADDMTSELRDNKERLEVALAAEQVSAEMQNSFLSMLSHEYRTPLAVIQGNLDILEMQSREYLTSDESSALMKMRRAVMRLVEIMDVSLERSRILDTKVPTVFKTIILRDFVRQQVDAIKWMYPAQSFFVAAPMPALAMSGDLPLLNTALFNLLDNARKYSIPGTMIEVYCRQIDEGVLISVCNESDMLNEGEIDELFEKYTRGRKTNNTSGAGIGLWLVRKIVEQHGGTVRMYWVKGEKVTVSMTIPSFTIDAAG